LPNQAELFTTPVGIDLHVHLRDPSTNKAETIRSGTKAALLGGFALVCDMPNNPGRPTWSPEAIKDKHRRIRRGTYIPVATYAGSQPEQDNIGELEAMAEYAIGLKLYGAPTTGNTKNYDSGEFREIVAEWNRVAPEKPIMLHSGPDNLVDFIDLIAKEHNHHLHVCHVNSIDDVGLINKSKRRGLAITSAVTPQHIIKTSHEVSSEGWFSRYKPDPVHQDVAEELLYLLARGSIDALETDHAPHTKAAKWKAELENPEGDEGLGDQQDSPSSCFGVPGIEFALPLLFYQVKRNKISEKRLIEAVSKIPADIIGVRLTPHSTVTWSMEEYRIDDERSMAISGSKWTPYLGKLAVGKVHEVKVLGKPLVQEGKIINKEPRVINREQVI
jgi:dihydroorotase